MEDARQFMTNSQFITACTRLFSNGRSCSSPITLFGPHVKIVQLITSDLVSHNLDSGFAAFLSNRVDLRHYVFAGEQDGNSIPDLRQFASHYVAVPTAILPMNVQRVKSLHWTNDGRRRRVAPTLGLGGLREPGPQAGPEQNSTQQRPALFHELRGPAAVPHPLILKSTTFV